MAKSVPKLSGLIKSGAFSTTSEDDPPPLASGLQGTTSTTAPPNDLPHATEVGTGEVIEGGNRSFLVGMRAGGHS